MIVPVLSNIAYSKDGKTVTLKDGTGTYAETTNPGGYGGPNISEPNLVALSARYWPDSAIYGSVVVSDETFIEQFIANGKNFTVDYFGGTAGEQFSPGVHIFKYYPLEVKTLTVTLTANSKVVTVVSGTDIPSGWNAAYLGIVFKSVTDNSLSKLYLIDRTTTLLAGSFNLLEEFAGTTGNYTVYIGTEADLKVLTTVPAQECLVKSIEELTSNCDTTKLDQALDMTMQMFAAEINFNCSSFDLAHSKIYNIYLTCSNCKSECECA